jgi:hypothetical protein
MELLHNQQLQRQRLLLLLLTGSRESVLYKWATFSPCISMYSYARLYVISLNQCALNTHVLAFS